MGQRNVQVYNNCLPWHEMCECDRLRLKYRFKERSSGGRGGGGGGRGREGGEKKAGVSSPLLG